MSSTGIGGPPGGSRQRRPSAFVARSALIRGVARALALHLALRLAPLALACGLVLTAPAARAALEGDTPPPVSGRRLSAPDGILPADVLARVELLRANTHLVRRYMGKPPAPPPLLQVSDARPSEVYSQALNVQALANRLAFEQVRVVRTDAMPLAGEPRPADVFQVVDSALASVLLVKRELGIEEVVAEERRPESTTPSDVFNAITHVDNELNQLLDRRTSPSDVFQLVTAAVHLAATLHATIPDGPNLADEPAFEPDRTPADVFTRLQRCFELVTRIAGAKQIQVLTLVAVDGTTAPVSPNDVSELAALLVEELTDIHRTVPEARPPARAYYPGRRFPSHVYQRAGLLQRILEDLEAALVGPAAPAPGRG